VVAADWNRAPAQSEAQGTDYLATSMLEAFISPNNKAGRPFFARPHPIAHQTDRRLPVMLRLVLRPASAPSARNSLSAADIACASIECQRSMMRAPTAVATAPAPWRPPGAAVTAGSYKPLLIYSTRSHARRYDISREHAAVEIEPVERIVSNGETFPGPIRSPLARSTNGKACTRHDRSKQVYFVQGAPEIVIPLIRVRLNDSTGIAKLMHSTGGDRRERRWPGTSAFMSST
jgi:hypothetical protein